MTLLWHGNFFNEPEYWDWQWVCERLLDRFAKLKPWCATGAEINDWWRAREGLVMTVESSDSECKATVKAKHAIEGVVLEVDDARATGFVTDEGPVRVQSNDTGWRVFLPPLAAGCRFCVWWDGSD